MSLTSLPVIGTGQDLGPTKSDARAATDTTRQLAASEWNAAATALEEVCAEVGLGDGSTAGSLVARVNDIEAALFSVTAHGAVGDGATDDLLAIQAAIDAAEAAGGGVVRVPRGTYAISAPIELAPGVTLEGEGASASIITAAAGFSSAYLVHAAGSAGSELVMTAAVAAGATSIPIPTASVADSDWLRLASVINSGSTDAGAWQLGDRSTDDSYLAEFVQVKDGTTSATSATLYGATIFPYSNTAGADTDAALTQSSVAFVVSFHEGGGLRSLGVNGNGLATTSVVEFEWCRGVTIDDCTIDAGEGTRCVWFTYCLDCHVRGSRALGKKAATGSSHNVVVLRSSQLCTAANTALWYGYQAFDITYYVNDATARGGPSIMCGADDCRSITPILDGFTDHPGCYMSRVVRCHVTGAPRGVRVRSRGALVSECQLVGVSGTSGIGIYVAEAAAVDSIVAGNVVSGFDDGIDFDANGNVSASSYLALFAAVGGGALISGNVVRNSAGNGITALALTATTTFVSPKIIGNHVHSPGTHGISIGTYNNGAVVDGNKVFGVPSGGYAGVNYNANIARLTIDNTHVFDVDATSYAIKGPSSAAFMTDATTFPSGESAALLYLGRLWTDAATLWQSIIRDSTAYVTLGPPGFVPFTSSISNSDPGNAGRGTLTAYADEVNGKLIFKTRNSAGTISTFEIAATP